MVRSSVVSPAPTASTDAAPNMRTSRIGGFQPTSSSIPTRSQRSALRAIRTNPGRALRKCGSSRPVVIERTTAAGMRFFGAPSSGRV